MTRTFVVSALVVLLVLGLVFGWFLQQWLEGGVVQRRVAGENGEVELHRSASKAGFCCMTIGSACTPVPNPGACFRDGGRSFNAVRRNCDYYCLNVKS